MKDIKNNIISIFTPTYNRAYLLKALKSCMDKQKNMNFEWIIIDDGSTDNTEKLVNSWLEQTTPYCIKYIKQKNQGKHIAFNEAVKYAKGEWFICVDSDDQLTENAVNIMTSDVNEFPYGCVGIVYPKELADVYKEKEWEKINGKKIDIMDLKVEYGIPESTILMKMSEFQDLEFPQMENEKFIPESWLYQKLIQRGKFLAKNKKFYIAEYQDDGLTKNVWNLWAKNAMGVLSVLREKYNLLGKYSLMRKSIERIKCIININTICMASGKKIKKESPAPIKSKILILPSYYFYKKRYK